MKIEQLTTDLGFDMRLQAILTRAEQLTRQEGAALVENKTLVYSLQKKVLILYCILYTVQKKITAWI